jgi:membrane protease YdiL (CAAX protease family)
MDDDFVKIVRADGVVAANLAREALLAASIQCVVETPRGGLGSVFGTIADDFAGFDGPFEIQVARRDEARAREVLKTAVPPEERPEAEIQEPLNASVDASVKRRDGLLVSLMLIGIVTACNLLLDILSDTSSTVAGFHRALSGWLISSLIVAGPAVFWLARTKGRALSLREVRWQELLLGVAMGLAHPFVLWALVVPLVSVLVAAGLPAVVASGAQDIASPSGGPYIVLLIIGLPALAFLTELVFRAHLIHGLMERGSSPSMAVTVSSLVFGLANMSGGVAGVVFYGLQGLLLGTVFVNTRQKLLPVIVAQLMYLLIAVVRFS